MQFTVGNIIQSNFGSGDHGNFETVLLEGDKLVHYWRDNSNPRQPWNRGQTLNPNTAPTRPAWIIQSDFGDSEHGNFEVVALEGTQLVHYWHDNSDVNKLWQRGQTISRLATGPGCIIQSDFGSDDHGNFEAIVLEGTQLVHYWHDNSDVNKPWQRGQTITHDATGPGCIIQSDFGDGDHGNFEVVVLEGHQLVHYWHDNSDVDAPWRRGQTITNQADGPGCIIQSDFISGGHGNFEVVVLEGHNLTHHWHDNSDVNKPWQRGQTISTAANGPGCIIQSDYGVGSHRNFEVLAQECDTAVIHYYHNNAEVTYPWRRTWFLRGNPSPPKIRGTRKVVQLTGEDDRQFRTLAHNQTASRFGVTGTDLGSSFLHDGRLYFLFGDTNTDNHIRQDPDSARDSVAWTTDMGAFDGVDLTFNLQYPHVEDISQGGFEVPTEGFSTSAVVTGPAWIIQSDFGNDEHGNFELVVLEGNKLVHYWHDNSDVNKPWQRAQIITDHATGTGCIIQSDFGDGEHGNFEVVVLEGRNLVHYWHDNSDVNKPWQRGQTITTRATGPGCIIQSDFRSDNHGNFEVVVIEGNQLVHYWHDNSDVNKPWQRAQIITANATGPGCIIQSDFGSDDHGNFEVVVQAGNTLVHYWHDNSDVNTAWQRGQVITWDATGPGCIIQSDFSSDEHGNFEVVVQEGSALVHHWHDNSDVNAPWRRGQTVALPVSSSVCIIQGNFGSTQHGNFEVVIQEGQQLVHHWHDNSDVRLPWARGQVITTPNMFVFFTTDHNDEGEVMGRTVLANSKDGGREFGHSLYTLSRDKFINVSCEIVKNENLPGLPDSAGKGLLIWGSGRYRSSDVYLAYMPLDQVERRESIWYLAGMGPRADQPFWSRDEADAVPLFCGGNVGELSVRWNNYLQRWLMLYNSDTPRGIILRMAEHPWRDWSQSWVLFEPGDQESWPGQGYGFFMHQDPDDVHHDDGLSDPDRIHEGGGEYGPYQMIPYTTGVKGQYTKIHFTMSVWNPYNVMQMTAAFTLQGQEPDPSAYAGNAEAPNDRKYARVSTLMAQLAATKGMTWDAPGHGNLVSADHIEWAQFQSYRTLRDELKAKFRSMINRLQTDEDKANAYATITDNIVTLGANGPYDFVNHSAHYRWALEAIRGDHTDWLISEMDLRIEREPFLPDHDTYCYAYGSDASNDRKYARVSLLQARLAANAGMVWDYSGQGILDGNAYVAWARFRPVETLRQELKAKFYQMIYKLPNNEAKSNAYARLTNLMVELGANGPFDLINYSAHYNWALNAVNAGNWLWLASETNQRIDREHFLTSTPGH
jgi:hypothetical protein